MQGRTLITQRNVRLNRKWVTLERGFEA